MRGMHTDAQAPAEAGPVERERLRHFDRFRAVSILMVVAGHCYMDWQRDTIPGIVVANLVTGATALFVFISGFFFHYAFHRDFDYRRFLRKKTIGVLVPYLVMSTVITVYQRVRNGRWVGTELDRFDDPLSDRVGSLAFNLLTGATHYVYWYVPFIMLMFVLSPLFLRFIALRPGAQWSLVALALLVSAVVWRPTANLNPVHSVVYLTGFYLLGILYSLNRRRIDEALARVTLVGLWGLVGLIALGSAMAGQSGNAHKTVMWDYQGVDWMVPLKLAEIAAILATSLAFVGRGSRAIDYLARVSFAIFFVHPVLISPMTRLVPPELRDTALGAAMLFALVMAATLLTIWLAKTILKDRSRFIIGY